jgi:hypothetical protein
LVTNLLDLPAELVAIGYKHRWAVEICQFDYRSSIELYLERLAA